MRVTLGDAKASRALQKAVGGCSDDSRFLDTLNEAIQRLLFEGKWWGTVQRYQFCAIDGCVTLPRTVAAIEAVAVCGRPIPIRDMWFEFIENGFGTMQTPMGSNAALASSGCCGNASAGGCNVPGAIYRGQFPGFGDIITTGNPKTLKLVCDRVTDVGKQVLVLGYDSNLNWIRTEQNGTIKDGELITLGQSSTGGGSSLLNWSTYTDIQAPDDLDGQWWLYEHDTVAGTDRMIGQYEYDDTRPSYGRWLLPVLPQSTSDGACSRVLVEALVKLEYIPLKNDTDYLIIGNIPALKEMMKGISDAEDEGSSTNGNQIILGATAIATRILDKELDHHFGSGRKLGMSIVGSSTDGTQVPVLI